MGMFSDKLSSEKPLAGGEGKDVGVRTAREGVEGSRKKGRMEMRIMKMVMVAVAVAVAVRGRGRCTGARGVRSARQVRTVKERRHRTHNGQGGAGGPSCRQGPNRVRTG